MANSRPEEKLNHVSLDGNEGYRITKRARETNDTKSKKGMKNTKEEKATKEILGVCR
jgi:hypothetical protein